MNSDPNSDVNSALSQNWVECTVHTPKEPRLRAQCTYTTRALRPSCAHSAVSWCTRRRIVAHWAPYRGAWAPCRGRVVALQSRYKNCIMTQVPTVRTARRVARAVARVARAVASVARVVRAVARVAALL